MNIVNYNDIDSTEKCTDYNELMMKSYDQPRIENFNYISNPNLLGNFLVQSATNRESHDKQLFFNEKFLKKHPNLIDNSRINAMNKNIVNNRLSTLTMNTTSTDP